MKLSGTLLPARCLKNERWFSMRCASLPRDSRRICTQERTYHESTPKRWTTWRTKSENTLRNTGMSCVEGPHLMRSNQRPRQQIDEGKVPWKNNICTVHGSHLLYTCSICVKAAASQAFFQRKSKPTILPRTVGACELIQASNTLLYVHESSTLSSAN